MSIEGQAVQNMLNERRVQAALLKEASRVAKSSPTVDVFAYDQQITELELTMGNLEKERDSERRRNPVPVSQYLKLARTVKDIRAHPF
ncbi:hypothetical protein M8C21_033779 [Ambrosia artemisiifolia]|uniref:Uncharacterized protein n=1 Tax=Ambrosia artemisiifolia TaxID=4212 RepID=A0AAD5G640_AMBAR|nr:hypothetical protein M8C21_033779 [Ambrosia artemisiifolia]